MEDFIKIFKNNLDLRIVARQDMLIKRQETADKHKLKGFFMTPNIIQNSIIESNKLENIMSYCYGTEHYYKIPQYSFKYTDGAKTFCEKAGAYWLLDIVASISRHYKQMHEDFIIIDLIVVEDNKATITFEDTKGIFFKQDILFTDCPKGLWKFYFDNNVFFWNGEY